ncbi:DUF4397 domain-containing protein [Sorangium sp. So ce269]
MKKHERWAIALAALGALSAITGACGDDDAPGDSGHGAGGAGGAGGGTGGAGGGAGGAGGGTSASGGGEGGAGGAQAAGGAGGEAGGGGSPDCGLPPDTDPEPKVRFINALLSNVSGPIGLADPPALRFHVGGEPVPDLGEVSAGDAAASVTKYAKIEAGAVTFSARSAEGLTISADPLTVRSGARYTVIAVGILDQTDTTKPHLLVAEENFATPECDEVALRFVNADFNTFNPKSFYVDRSATAAAALDGFSASDEEGVVAPLATRSITVTAPIAFGPTGQAPFSIPPGSLAAGRSYFVIETGEPTRVLDDRRAHGLLIVPAGDDAPAVWVKRDPLVYLFHASPPPTPSNLNVVSGTEQVAINLKYAEPPTYTDLPPEGATLALVDASSEDAVVVGDQATGPLDPGGIYLGGLIGTAGGTGDDAQQLKLWKIQPSLDGTFTVPRVMMINASTTAPAVDLGHWSVNEDGTRGDTFTAVLTGIAYGSASATTGVDFAAPSAAGAQWLGVQPTGSPDAIRSASGPLQTLWYTAVLMGDWSSTDPASAAQLVLFRNFGSTTSATPLPLPRP